MTREELERKIAEAVRDDRGGGGKVTANADEIGRQQDVAARLHALVSH